MAIFYLDTDSPTDGVGTELDPFNNINSALTGRADGDLLLFEGTASTTTTLTSAGNILYYEEVGISPKNGTDRLHWIITSDGTRTNQEVIIQAGVKENIDWEFDMVNETAPVGFWLSIQNGSADETGLIVSSTFTITNLNSTSALGSLLEVDGWMAFNNCVFDHGGTSVSFDYSDNIIISVFDNCTFKNWIRTSGSSEYLKMDGSHAIFTRCKMYNLQDRTENSGIFAMEDDPGKMQFQNCSFYECGGDGIIKSDNIFNSDYDRIIVNSCIFEKGSSPIVNTLAINGESRTLGGVLAGSNIFVGHTNASYTPSVNYPDSTEVVTQFANTDENSPLFLSLASGVLAEDYSVYPNLSCGAYQAVGGGGGSGETDPDKVLSNSSIISGNVDVGNVINTETYGTYVPVATTDVRDGTAFGAASAETGSLDLPAITDVRDGVVYDNTTKTGTLNVDTEANLPATTDVRETITYGSSNQFTGTLDPDTEANIPANTDVRSGVTYGEGNAQTGTLDIDTEANLPIEDNVIAGVTYGENLDKTGNFVITTSNNVRDGVAIGPNGSVIGTLDLPSENDTRLGVTYDNTTKTGNVRLPAASDVRSGVGYDSLDSVTGTLDIDTEANLPANTDVRAGITYGETNSETGSLDLPSINDVRDGVQYDNLTKEGNVELPAEADVRDGTTYGSLGTEFTGNLATGGGETDPDKVLNTSVIIAGNYDPIDNASDVRAGVTYGLSETGTLDVDVEANLPTEANVRDSITYGSSNQFTGSLDVDTAANLPDVSEVEAGVTYGSSNQLTGTAVLQSPQPGPIQVIVYTDDGSNISGTTPQSSITVSFPSGTKTANEILADLGAAETIGSGASVERRQSDNAFLDIKIERL